MVQEIEPADLAHAEADTFWVLNELWADLGQLSVGEEVPRWLRTLGERLSWADPELDRELVRSIILSRCEFHR